MVSLTGKQTAFAEEYCRNGQNGVQAAKTAGYKGKTNQLGQRAFELVNNSKVKAAIDKEMAEIKDETIATRAQRQLFWTEVYKDTQANMSDRLRASELLGKSEADFTDNLNTSTTEQRELSETEAADAKIIGKGLIYHKLEEERQAG